MLQKEAGFKRKRSGEGEGRFLDYAGRPVRRSEPARRQSARSARNDKGGLFVLDVWTTRASGTSPTQRLVPLCLSSEDSVPREEEKMLFPRRSCDRLRPRRTQDCTRIRVQVCPRSQKLLQGGPP